MNNYEVAHSDDAIDDLLADCEQAEADGGSSFPGMTYEDGVAAAIRWLVGQSDSHPLED